MPVISKKKFILLFNFITFTTSCFGMTTSRSIPVYRGPERFYEIDPVRKDYDVRTKDYFEQHRTKNSEVLNSIKALEADRHPAEMLKEIKAQNQAVALQRRSVIKPGIVQNVFLQKPGIDMSQQDHKNQTFNPSQKDPSVRSIDSDKSFVFLDDTKIVDKNVAPPVDTQNKPLPINVSNPELGREAPASVGGFVPESVATEMYDKYSDYFHKKLFTFIKTSMRLFVKSGLVQFSLADMVTEAIQQLLFRFSELPESFKIKHHDPINIFRTQIQYLAKNIGTYNTTTNYTNPEQMLFLIEFINRFLKENNVISFSSEMLVRLNGALKFAKYSCDIFKRQNIIFSSSNAPQAVLSFFKPVIDNANKLSNIKLSAQLMRDIYNKNGYMDQIMEIWIKFQAHDLYKTPANRQYAAFLTFLLLFENSMVAAAIILDETSSTYKVTNSTPVTINIAESTPYRYENSSINFTMA